MWTYNVVQQLELMEKLISLTGKESLMKKWYLTWVLKNENNFFKQRKRTVLPQGTLSNTQSPDRISNVWTWAKYQNWTEEQRFSNSSVHQKYFVFLLKMQISEPYPGYSDLENLGWYLRIFILPSTPYYSDGVRGQTVSWDTFL